MSHLTTRVRRRPGRAASSLKIATAFSALALLPSVGEAQQGWNTVVVAAEHQDIPSFGEPIVTLAGAPRLVAKDRSPSRERETVAKPAAEVAEKAAPVSAQVIAKAATADVPGQTVEGGAKTASTSLAQQYCANIVDAAADARIAWQKKQLTDLERELDKRVALLESKTTEYRQWLARRDEFSRKAQDTLVTIYSRMRPEAAALQLTSMDEEVAAAILMKLDPRVASNVLNDMVPAKAARLASTMSGAGKVPADANANPAAETGRP